MSLSNRDATVLAAHHAERVRAPGCWHGFAAAFGLLLLEFGNADGSTFFAPQDVMADRLGWHDSHVRRVLRTARRLGLLAVTWTRPERGADGRWSRRRVNRYALLWKRARGSLRAKRLVPPTGSGKPLIPEGSNPLSVNAFRGPAEGPCGACNRPAGDACLLADRSNCGRLEPP